MKKFLTLLTLLALCTFNVNAQNKKNIKDSSTVIIFNKPGTATTHHKTGEDNIIKIAPLGVLSGTFPLLYERRITDFFGLQVGAGLTHRNYIRGAIQQDFSESKISYSNGIQNDYSENLYSFQYRTPKMGYMYTIQPRFYFDSDGLDGSYLGLSLDHYIYNFEIPGMKGNSGNYTQTGPIQSENEKITDFMVHLGYQNLYDRLTIEWSTAIGIRNVKGTKYAADFSGNTLIEGVGTYTQNVLNFNIGFKVGYHF